jgi:hypothetical protein
MSDKRIDKEIIQRYASGETKYIMSKRLEIPVSIINNMLLDLEPDALKEVRQMHEDNKPSYEKSTIEQLVKELSTDRTHSIHKIAPENYGLSVYQAETLMKKYDLYDYFLEKNLVYKKDLDEVEVRYKILEQYLNTDSSLIDSILEHTGKNVSRESSNYFKQMKFTKEIKTVGYDDTVTCTKCGTDLTSGKSYYEIRYLARNNEWITNNICRKCNPTRSR